jgi:membrane protein
VASILGDRLKALAAGNNVGLLTVGGIGAIWAASGGIVSLMGALNTVYGVEEKRPFWKVRGIALLTTLATAVISIVSAVVAVATPPLAAKLGGPFPTLVTWLRLPLAGVLMMFLWALLYFALPDVKQNFKFITPGSVVGVVIWLLASWGFSVYVANFGSYDANYGAIGGVIVMLMWMWISAQVILLGAEINSIIEHRSPEGKSPGQKVPGQGGVHVAATKTEVESAGGRLPGATDFRPDQAMPPASPPPLRSTPLAAHGPLSVC